MSPGASTLRRTFRLLVVGVAAGIVTSLAALFPIYALRGHPEAMTVFPVWLAGAYVGTIVGGLALPILGCSVLRRVPPRRIAGVVGAATWAGAVLFSLLNSAVVGAFTGALAAVTWLSVARPARDRATGRAAGAMVLGSLLARPLHAQATSPDPVGTWRGTSLCLVRPSACHDEIVVYRITDTGIPDSLALDGRKIVGAEEVEMGVLGCRFEAAGARLTCPIPAGVWQFAIRGDSLVGELRLLDGTRVRDVRTRRSPRAHP